MQRIVLVLLVLITPTTVRAQVRFVKNVTYGKGGNRDLKLDLAIPQGKGPFPVLVCLHGGGWVSGHRGQMENTIRSVASSGYVGITIDYRLAPGARFPAQIEDGKLAIRWIRAQAAKYNINPNRIGVVGFSSGAYLACMLGLTGKADGFDGLGANQDQSSAVQAVVSFAAPSDLTYQGWSEHVRTKNLQPLLGAPYSRKPALYKKASPITYVRKNAPAFLLFHGNEDPVVPLQQSQSLVWKLKAKDNVATLMIVEGEKHLWKGSKLVRSLERMMKFLDQHLKKP